MVFSASSLPARDQQSQQEKWVFPFRSPQINTDMKGEADLKDSAVRSTAWYRDAQFILRRIDHMST